MAATEPRTKRSKLYADDPLDGDERQPAPAPASPPPVVAPVTPAPRSRRTPPAVASRSRRRSPQRLPDLAMVAFSAKITVIARRALRELAAREDVDMQDLLEDAVVEYMERRGIAVPRRPAVEEEAQ